MNNIALRLLDPDSYFSAIDEDDAGVYEQEFKGKPVLIMKHYDPSGKYVRVAIGVRKAEMILENIKAVKEFVKRHRKGRIE